MTVDNIIYSNKIILKVIAYTCLMSAIAFVLSSFLYMLKILDFIDFYTGSKTIGNMFFGQSILSILMFGYIVNRKNFCNWSKMSWFIVIIYYCSFLINKFVSFDVVGVVILNVILLTISFSMVRDLIKNKFSCIK